MPAAKNLRDMQDSELTQQVRNSRKEIFGLRFQHATGELENTAGLKAAKRELARALTVARQRGIDPNQIR